MRPQPATSLNAAGGRPKRRGQPPPSMSSAPRSPAMYTEDAIGLRNLRVEATDPSNEGRSGVEVGGRPAAGLAPSRRGGEGGCQATLDRVCQTDHKNACPSCLG